MKRRYQDGGEVDAMEEANNRSMLTPRKVSIGSSDAAAEDEKLNRRTMERSRDLQDRISAGSDIVGRPQDEGYRPNAGTARERAMAEGAYDSDKITESGDQGFGGPGSSRTVKATPKAMPKAKSEPKAEVKPAAKTESAPAAKADSVDMTKLSANERTKQQIEKNLTNARSGSGSTDERSVNDRIRDSGIGSSISNYFKNFKTPAQRKSQEQKEKAAKGSYSSGGKVSASSRGDGIAQRGKTRGKMC
jgi:hypothetical protein